MKKYLALALCLAGASFVSAALQSVHAETWPARPVKVIVGFAPGGPTDLFARLIAQKLTEATGKNFYIENVPGAGGNVGAVRAAQSPADGYTLLVTGGNLTNNPFLFVDAGFDPLKDFDAVTVGAATPVVLAINPSVPAQTRQGIGGLDPRQSRQGKLRLARHRHAAAARRRAVCSIR